MSNVISIEYKNIQVSFNEDGWFNATVVSDKYGKRPIDWLNQEGTKEYVLALSALLKCEPKSLLKTKKGNNGAYRLRHRL